jgi:hypothetical protein
MHAVACFTTSRNSLKQNKNELDKQAMAKLDWKFTIKQEIIRPTIPLGILFCRYGVI